MPKLKEKKPASVYILAVTLPNGDKVEDVPVYPIMVTVKDDKPGIRRRSLIEIICAADAAGIL